MAVRTGFPPNGAETPVALEAGATTAQEICDTVSVSIDNELTHIKILESAGLVSRHRGMRVQVKPLWGADLLEALDDWAAAMGTNDVADRRRAKHQAQREEFRKRRRNAHVDEKDSRGHPRPGRTRNW